ncbi:MAG: signal peptide peptidase SppA [Bryobacterales bacterium]|nr:signal peptide peptidase SppA [Bryobacterales bacterium]
MRKFIGRILAWIGGITVAFVILIFVIATFTRGTTGKVPAKSILEINLESAIAEDALDDPFLRLSGRTTPVLRDIVEALEKARDDSRVTGLIARMGAAPISMAQAQELRDAIAAFRAKKKFAIAFAETYGEFGPGNSAYYLATAFDEIWLQPSGDLGLTGVAAEGMFLRGALDKLGVIPRMDHRHEFKSAMETYTEKKFTPAAREAMSRILESSFSQMVAGIAQGRKLKEAEVRSLIDRGPYLGKEAVAAKLVDGVAYRDEIFAKVKAKAGPDAQFLYLDKYLDRAGRPHQKGPVVALIHGLGPVHRGKSGADPLGGETSMGSDTVAAAFRDAINDKSVKAILFRVDSPGGSYVASDTIWNETMRAKKAGKPVIVSMSSVAGSGGYFVAMAADKIVAQPATITGSIGVLGGKMLTNGLWDKLGISWDEVHNGQNARMFSSSSDYSKEEWARIQAWLDRVYDDFTSKVAAGRKLPKEKVLEVAKGRIWTGEDAKARGLVDELGGYPAALKLVKQAIKAKESDDVTLRVYPKKKTTVEALMAKLNQEEGESSESKQAELMLRVLDEVRPAVKAFRAIRGDDAQILSMPQLTIRP